MFDCPQCGSTLADAAVICNTCRWQPVPTAAGGKEPSETALRAATARRLYESNAPSSADLTAQQWYNVCRFYRSIAVKASQHSHRPLADVGPHNPLDKTAQAGPPVVFFLKRRGFPPQEREPGEDG